MRAHRKNRFGVLSTCLTIDPMRMIEALERRQLLSSTIVQDNMHAVLPAPAAIDPSVGGLIVDHNLSTGVDTVSNPAQLIKDKTKTNAFQPEITKQDPVEPINDPGYIFSPDSRVLVAGSVYSAPYVTIGRMWIQWPDGSEASASGSMIGPRTMLTAGHCVYDASHGGWASTISFSPAQDGTYLTDPYFASSTTFKRSNNQYYGEAYATNLRSYSGWTSSGNWDYDMGVVTLDRNIGNFTGWDSYGYNDNNAAFQNVTMYTAGYPGDLTPNSYDMWRTSDQVTAVNTLNMQSNKIDIWPGQSGSPLYNSSNTTYGVVSSQWTDGSGNPSYNQFTRINGQRFSDIGSYVTADSTTTDRPELTSYDEWYGSAFDSHTTSATQGGAMSFTSYVRNNGTASAGSFNVSFYASTNNIISTGDTLIGSATISSLGAFAWTTASLTTNLPVTLPSGTYYVGYVIDSGNSQTEYAEYNNARLMPSLLSVTAISADRFEPNDSIAGATNFGTLSGTRTENGLTIHTTGNGDFYRFTAAANGSLTATINFTHANGDTDMQLLDTAGNSLASSSGVTNTETFTYTVTRGTTYVLNVYGYAGALDPSYNMTLSGPAVPADRFEANDSLAAATSFGSLSSTRVENDLTIHAANNQDFYSFTPTVTGKLDASISFIHADGDIDMQLMKTDGTVIAGSYGTGNSESTSIAVVAGTTYVFNVYGFGGSVNWDYDLSLGVTPAPVATSQTFNYITGPQRLTYAFSQTVSASLDTSDLSLYNATTGTYVPTANIAVNAATGTFTFPGYANGILPNGNYSATLLASGVTNSSGVHMPADANTTFFALAGDANHDRTVNVADLGILATNWQQSGRNFSTGDFNYDGVVNVADLGILATYWQVTLPASAPTVGLPVKQAASLTGSTDPRVNGGVLMPGKLFSVKPIGDGGSGGLLQGVGLA